MAKVIGSLIVAVLLLVPVAASAECAWVLWAETVPQDARAERRWSIEGIFDQKDKCASMRAAFVGSPDPRGDKMRETSVLREVNYLCLPDTIDPRPKGGGR